MAACYPKPIIATMNATATIEAGAKAEYSFWKRASDADYGLAGAANMEPGSGRFSSSSIITMTSQTVCIESSTAQEP
ncbi:MAG: Uncharacterised protein [Pseudidiomarina mangrovi]|nr:MAG: Uncharacterised protein [Pseudidiomarina mangrovi]